MKVSSDINRVMNVYNQNVKSTKQVEAKKSKSDTINISVTGREISKYVELASKSEIKSPNFDEIKKLVDQNKYQVDSEKLAKAIADAIKEGDV